jgi:SAM-dependent methyltransferase
MPEKFVYDFHRTRDWTYYAVYLKRFRNNPSPILEMGSGIGLFLEACRQNNVEAAGLEYEAEGVEAARAAGLHAVQHDLGNPVPFPDESFAAVFSNQVIEHLTADAQRTMIAEAFRVLRPGGQALIISPCRHWPPAREDKYHIGLLTPSELRGMMEAVGFVDCNMGYNRMQEIPGAEAEWKASRPDHLSQDAVVLAWKPR